MDFQQLGGPRLIGGLEECRSIRKAQRLILRLETTGGSLLDTDAVGLISSFWKRQALQVRDLWALSAEAR